MSTVLGRVILGAYIAVHDDDAREVGSAGRGRPRCRCRPDHRPSWHDSLREKGVTIAALDLADDGDDSSDDV